MGKQLHVAMALFDSKYTFEFYTGEYKENVFNPYAGQHVIGVLPISEKESTFNGRINAENAFAAIHGVKVSDCKFYWPTCY